MLIIGAHGIRLLLQLRLIYPNILIYINLFHMSVNVQMIHKHGYYLVQTTEELHFNQLIIKIMTVLYQVILIIMNMIDYPVDGCLNGTKKT
eukprot:UN05814